jgi:hypothetical protein
MTASANFFDSVSIFLIFFATVVFILVFFEAGFRVGKYMLSRYAKKTDAALGPMVGSTLAMLAFVLAITFSMAASRFDQRKQNLLAEVNAIEIAYLRADLLAQPQKTKIKRYLLEYVDTRLLGAEKGARESALSKTLMLHNLLWTEVKSAVQENPTRLSAMVVQSVNDIITIHEKRMTYAIRQRVPLQIWFALYAIAAFAMVAAGSQAGLSESRRILQVIPTALGFVVLMTLIIDLDRPVDVGLTKVNQTAMIDLRGKMDSAAR